MLKSTQSIKDWTRSRVKVKAFEGTPIVPDISDLKREISSIIFSNVIGELDMEFDFNGSSQNNLFEHLLEKREGTRKIVDDFIASHKDSKKPACYVFESLLYAFHQSVASDPKSMGKLLALLRISLERVRSEFTEEELTNIRNNFDDIDTRIKSWTSMGNSRTVEGLILTAINSDPKFLLTIGDLVEAQSCQNYRTGSHIETLMGYVIDANVQGLASFFIGPESFENDAQYSLVFEAAKANKLQSIFDGNKRTIIFKIDGSEKTISVDLPKALYRSMIKLGVTESGGAGLKMERAYTPSLKSDYLQSGLSAALSQSAEEVFTGLVNDLDATTQGTITVYGSRSPGGMYSDLGGGVKVGDYTIGN